MSHVPLFPERHKPATGVKMDLHQNTIVFLTVCTKDRRRWLASQEAHQLLRAVWLEGNAWLVGRYVLMPDHLHLFAAPYDLRFTIEAWCVYWKRRFTQAHKNSGWKWQASAFHHRLRHGESYDEKWRYVMENPVRAKLVTSSFQWPYQGFIHELPW